MSRLTHEYVARSYSLDISSMILYFFSHDLRESRVTRILSSSIDVLSHLKYLSFVNCIKIILIK